MAALPRPPGPKGHFILGAMPEFNRDPLGFITRCAREYGDVVGARFFHITAYFLNHPSYIEYVLATNNRNFIKPLFFRSTFFRRLVGNGLLTSEGDFWRRQRRLSQPAFHRERINAYGKVMVRSAERMLDTWQDEDIRDIHRDMTSLSMEIVTRTLFNVDVTSDSDEVSAAFQALAEPFSSQATLKWMIDNLLPTPSNRRFHMMARRLDQVIYKIISQRRAQREQEHGDLLSMLLQARDEDGSRMTDEQLRDEVLTLFMAGQQTTALTLAWTWYLLAKHPEAEAKLWAELDGVLGERLPEAADVPRLKFTEMLAKESMRLYPPAYTVGREVVRECEIGGYRVPAGTQLFMSQWVIHRDPRYYEAPEEFKPERWEDDLASRLPKYAYFPFGGGPRVCIGNTFAMMKVVLLLATIARKYRFTLATEHPVTLMPAMSLRPRHGIKVIVHRR